MKVYGSQICSGCREFKAVQAERGFEAEFIDITESVANLRAFLVMRDNNALFENIRKEGRIGIPVFEKEDGTITLDINEAMAWIGQPPVEEKSAEAPVCESCG